MQTVGCSVTCGAESAFDAILHVLVFTFVSDVPALFSGGVLEHYARTVMVGVDTIGLGCAGDWVGMCWGSS